MRFTKSYYIGQALLRIGGGVVTPDLAVRRGEAETYFAMAVNYVQTGNYWLETKAEGEKTINPLLSTAFDDVPILYSDDHLRYYSDLPSDVITIPKGRALEITTMCGKVCYPLVQSDEALERFYGKYKPGIISYKLEAPKRVWLYGDFALISGLRPKYIVHVNDIDDDTPILLPSDGDIKVIDMMVNFLLAEKQEEKDYTEDAKSN